MKTYRHSDHLNCFSFSVQGSTHILMGEKPCEDTSLYQCLQSKGKTKYALVVTADGVGSCKYANIASRTAASSARDLIVNEIQSGIKPDCKMIERAMKAAHLSLLQASHVLNLPNTDELGTTLDVVLMSEKGKAFIGHNGDGGVVILHRSGSVSGTTKMNTPNGAVYTVDWESKDNQHAWAIHEVNNVAAILVATDGIYDYLTSCGSTLKTSLLEQLHIFERWKTKAQFMKRANRIKQALVGKRNLKRVTDDDITLAMLGFSRGAEIAARKAGIIID